MGMVHNTTTPDIETASEDYRRRFQGEVGAYFIRVQEDAVKKCLSPLGSGPLKILEVGGGHGQITEALLRDGHEVCVQGSAEQCFERLKGLSGNFGERLQFKCSSLWNIPFPDRHFDVVIALRLLGHVERWRELLAEMSRLAARSVIVDYPSSRALNALGPVLFGVKKRIEGNTRPYFNYSGRELRAELGKSGFRDELTVSQFFFPMGLHRALGRAAFSSVLERCAGAAGLTKAFGSPVVLAAFGSPGSPAKSQ